MRELKDLILLNKEVTYYRIREVKKNSFQIFFVHKNLETIRNTDTKDVKVKIYVLHDGKLGDSEFTVYASNTEDEIIEKINSSVAKAKLVSNEVYTLPEKDCGFYPNDTNFNDYSLAELAKLTEEAVYKADSYKDGSINALEVFITKLEETIKNSNGLEKTQVLYDAMIEAIPTWNGKRESVELYEQYHFNSLDVDKITAEIDDKMQAVKARYEAVKLDNINGINVLLRPLEISSIVSEFASDLNYGSIYQKANIFEIGDDIQKDAKGDLLTISVKAKVTGSTQSRSFDADGVTLKDTLLIEDGKVKNYFGSNQYAQYLKMDVTGNLPCIELKGGSKCMECIRKEPYLECVSMSGIQVDKYNDYIGGEVRLGYYYDGKKVTPVTGISISGKLSEVLKEMYLTRECVQDDAYYGPKLMLLKGMSIN